MRRRNGNSIINRAVAVGRCWVIFESQNSFSFRASYIRSSPQTTDGEVMNYVISWAVSYFEPRIVMVLTTSRA